MEDTGRAQLLGTGWLLTDVCLKKSGCMQEWGKGCRATVRRFVSRAMLSLSNRLHFYVIMTSQRELFPRLTADMRRFRKPRLPRETLEPVLGRPAWEAAESGWQRKEVPEPWEEVEDTSEFYAGPPQVKVGPGLFYTSPLFPLLASEVAAAQKQLTSMVQLAKCHCRRDNLWKRLFLLEPLASDKLKLGKLSLGELEELLDAVHRKSIADIDPQLVRAWARSGSIHTQAAASCRF